MEHVVISLIALVVFGLALAVGRNALLQDTSLLSITGRIRRLLAAVMMAGALFLGLGQLMFPVDAPEEHGVWLHDLNQGMAKAREENRLLLVDGWASWCQSCGRLKTETFSQEEVSTRLDPYVLVALDMDQPENEDLWTRFNLKGLPWVAVFKPDGTLIPDSVLVDWESPQDFLKRLDRVEAAALAGQDPGSSVEGRGIAGYLAGRGFLLTLLLVFLGGLAASLTPCAYPSYILIFGFLSSRGARPRRERILLALTTVAGIVITYVSVGIIAALGGGAVGRVMANPLVVGAIAVLFLVIGLASLKLIPFKEFTGIKTFLMKHQKANYLWALVFGLVLGLIVAPCVGPVMVGILTYIAEGQDVLRGASLMVSFAMGMGVLFLVFGLFSNLLIRPPQVGRIGEAVNLAFSILFLAMALYYLKGVLPYEELFPWLGSLAG